MIGYEVYLVARLREGWQFDVGAIWFGSRWLPGQGAAVLTDETPASARVPRLKYWLTYEYSPSPALIKVTYFRSPGSTLYQGPVHPRTLLLSG
jgi:hypothetical protein